MKLSRNAIRMLVAHYRSIYKKAFSVGLAGAVVATMGVASANEVPSDNTDFIITNNNDSYTLTKEDNTYNSFTSEANSKATITASGDNIGAEGRIWTTGDININGELTLKSENNKRVAILGIKKDGENLTYVSSATLGENSKLNLSGSALEAKNVTIKGGTHTIDGEYTETGWSNSPHILAFRGNLLVEKGSITLKKGFLAAGGLGSAVILNGGTITMQNTVNSGGDTTFIGSYDGSSTDLKDHSVTVNGAKIVVGDGTANQYGNIFAANINIKGSSEIDVKKSGSLTLDGNIIRPDTTTDETAGNNDAIITMDDGIITNAGTLTIGSAKDTTFTANAGSITNTGTINISGSATIGDNVALANVSDSASGTISVTGSLTIGATNLANTIKQGDEDGTYKGKLNIATNGSLVVAGAGNINLNDVIFSGTGVAGKISFADKGTFTAEDANATVSGDSLDTKSVNLTVGTLTIDKTVTTATNLSGSITILDNLVINPKDSKSNIALTKIGDNEADDINVSGSLTLGGQDSQGQNLEYDVNLQGGADLAVAGGNWSINAIEVGATDSTINAKSEGSSLHADSITVSGDFGTTIGSGDGSVSVDTLNVEKIKTVASNQVTINGDVSINKALTGNDKTSGSITVSSEGNLSLANEVIFKDGKVNEDIGKFNVSGGGYLTADTNGQASISAEEAKKLSGLINGEGLVDIGTTTVDGIKAVTGSQGFSFVNSDILSDLNNLQITNDDIGNATYVVSSDKAPAGKFGALRLQDSALTDSGASAVTTKGTLTLTGDKSGFYVYSADKKTEISKDTSGNYTVTSEGSSFVAQGIKIGSGDTLVLENQGSIGSMTAEKSGSGSLIVKGDVTALQEGEKLNSTKYGDIGQSGDGTSGSLASVEVQGSLTANNIYATTFKSAGNVEANSLSANLELTAGLTKVGTFTAGDANQSILGGELQADKIDLTSVTGSGKSFTIGSEFKPEKTVANNASDPAFVVTTNLSGSGSIAINVQDEATLALVQGESDKSGLTVLSDDLVAQTKATIAEAKGIMGGADSVLYIGKALTSTNNGELSGGITVGNYLGSGTTTGNLSVASNSLTVIDVENSTGTVINADVNAEDGAKAYVKDINVGDKLANNIKREGEGTGWTGKNLEFAYGGLKLDENDQVVYDNALAAQRYGRATAGELAYLTEVTKALVGAEEYQRVAVETNFGLGDTYLKDLMQRFGANGDAVVAHMTSVGRFAQLAGVETAAMAVINSGNNAIAQRLGVAGVESAQLATVNATSGASFWVAPTYSSVDADGFSAGAFNYGQDLDLGGVALGADFLSESGVRVGAMFNIGSGSSDSQGDLVYTENDFDYVGFSIYAGAKFGNFGLTADVGYTTISNDVDQRNIENFKADIDSSVVTAGLNGQYTFDLGVVDVIPHVGVRFNRINVDGYDVRYNGQTLMNADDETLNVVQFPIGVTLASEFKTGDLYFKPTLDLSVIPATGDTDADTDVHFISAFNEGNIAYTTEVYDDVAYSANLGLNAAYGNAQFGVVYNYTGSDNTDNHSVSLMGKYLF